MAKVVGVVVLTAAALSDRLASRRLVRAVFVLAMTLLVVWQVSLGRPRFYVCAAVIALVTACLALVRQRRHWLYAIGVFTCLATLTLAPWPTDPRGYEGLCTSAFRPLNRDTVRAIAKENGYDPAWYLRKCDNRRARNVKLVTIGGVFTIVVVAGAIMPIGVRRKDDDEALTGVRTPTP